MSSKLKPAIKPRNTGQRILCFDRCQLIIAWMFNIKEVHGKPKLYVSVNPGGVRATTAMHARISFISGHLLVIGIP